MPKASMLLTVLALLFPAGAAAACPASADEFVRTALVRNVTAGSSDGRAQVVIDLDREVRYRSARLTGPDRLYLDLSDARLGVLTPVRTIQVGSDALKQVRVGQNGPDMVRVVLEIPAAEQFSVSHVQDPFRIIIDLHGLTDTEAPSVPEAQAPSRGPEVPAVGPASNPVPDKGPETAQIQERPVPPEQDGSASPAQTLDPAAAEAGPAPPGEAQPLVQSPQSDPTPLQAPARSSAAPKKTSGPSPRQSARQTVASSIPERPLTISGTLSTGLYNAYTRGGGNENQDLRFAPAGAIFDINGFYLTPDLVDYWVQPEFYSGAQASDAGFLGGNGVRTRVSLLRRQMFPVTFRYANVQLTDAYFGSLTQVSSYTRRNRNKDLGVTAELKRTGLPSVTVDWGAGSVNSSSGIAVIPDYNSRSSHLNFDANYEHWGWDFRGSGGRQQQTSDLFAPLGEGTHSSILRQEIMQYQASARRSFLKDSEFYADAGSQSTANLLLNQPIDLTSRFASANLRIFQRRRWKTSMRAGYTSNIAGLLLTRLVGGLGSNGSIAPEAGVLAPFQHAVSYLNLNGMTTLDLSHGFGLYGNVDRTSLLKSSDAGVGSRYFSTSGGVTYTGTFGWGSISGQYGRSFGIGSVTGQTGRIEGQTYLVSAQPGKWDVLQLDFSLRGSDQKVLNETPAGEHSLSTEGSLGLRLVSRFRGRLGGGWQQSTFTNAGADFHTAGYTARAAIEHPRFQLNGSLNSSIGNSLQAYSQLFSGIATGTALLNSLRLAPSDMRGITLALHALPLRRLEITGSWTRSLQHLEGVVINDFEVVDAYATFHFRKLQFQAGFFRSRQTYTSYLATYPQTERGRYYIRVTRTVKFL